MGEQQDRMRRMYARLAELEQMVSDRDHEIVALRHDVADRDARIYELEMDAAR